MIYLIEPLLGEGSQRQREQAQAYDMLCRLVGGHPELAHDTNGAPFLPTHPKLCISISHCHEAVAVAVSEDGLVGIDIECRRRVSDGLIEKVCTEAEQEAIRNAADPIMQFLRFWTQKEAVLKMRRTGILGFGSMIDVSSATDCRVRELECNNADIVAAVAVSMV